MPTLIERLERRHRLNGECWTWIGKLDRDGYGRIVITTNGVKKERLVHRVAYELLAGDLPAELDHTCRNRACFNPSHLEGVTHRENVLRSPFVHKAHCKHGHAMTPENTRVHGSHRYCRACARRNTAEYLRRKGH